jgi:hypothetical protein
VLEPSDFAGSDDLPDPPPTDLVDRDTWFSIVRLPDDVAVRTSSYQGVGVKLLDDLWCRFVESVAMEDQDILDEVLLDAADDFQGAVFNALCGYYRLAFTSLRSVVELIAIGADAHLSGRLGDYEKWRTGEVEASFNLACQGLSGSGHLQTLKNHLQNKLSDSLFDSKQPDKPPGWARRLYKTLSNYAHSRPGYTDADARESNGPIYVPETFDAAVCMHTEVAALAFIMVKLARPGVVLPGGDKLFLEEHHALPEIARETWRELQK